jgi:hypothetical protein
MFAVLIVLSGCGKPAGQAGGPIDASRYASLQDAIDANPGKMIFVPAGIREISQPLRIQRDGAGIYGYGAIIQTSPGEDILQIRNAADVRIEGVTFRRVSPEFHRSVKAVDAENCRALVLKDLKILDNRTNRAAVLLTNSDYCRVEACEVINYKTIAIDDRVKDPLYGYAFNAIDGHGIRAINCKGIQILHNRVMEKELLPTKEIMEKYQLGHMVKRLDKLGPLASYGVSKDGFLFIWHQGAGIGVHGASVNTQTQIEGNYIENAAQGIDAHSDFMTLVGNHVEDCYIGLKAFHGSRGVIIANNIVRAAAKYGILLRPGSGSFEASEALGTQAARGENVERGFIISNNIISDTGWGSESWRLASDESDPSMPAAIKLGTGPLPENPVLRDVIVQGNLVYDRGRDKVLVDGKAQTVPPRYKRAVWMDEKPVPENIIFMGNIFHAGSKGVSNRKVTP